MTAGIRLEVYEEAYRVMLAILISLTTALFVASAAYALHALVKTREWNWSQPDELEVQDPNGRGKQGERQT